VRRSRRIAIPLAIIAAVLGVVVAPPAALAEPARGSHRAEMVRVGVDHAVAEANGFEVRVDSKGVEYSVPVGTPPGIQQEVVEGPCGWSYVHWINIDFWGHRGDIYTGFDIRPGWHGAIAVPTWDVVVQDAFGVSTKHLAPGTPGGIIGKAWVWSATHRFGASGATGAWADLVLGWAVLADGRSVSR
jgi:hypothetical protein